MPAHTKTLLADIVSLGKPSITALSVLMAVGGLWLAGPAGLTLTVITLVGTALTVASANALNMVIERETDALMTRTSTRPLPAGRMEPATALAFGLITGVLGIVLLALWVNLLTAGIATFALVTYAAVYTPLKRHTPHALVIGAVPGAAPPLMGWTAATGAIEGPGLVLFLVLFLWQMPHFLAIALFRKEDYARAGMKTVPIVRGDAVARIQALAYATVLLPVSLVLLPLHAAGWLYFAIATLAGVAFWWIALQGVRTEVDARWSRKLFGASLLYLPALVLGLVVDRFILF